jgi:hypothetical protein
MTTAPDRPRSVRAIAQGCPGTKGARGQFDRAEHLAGGERCRAVAGHQVGDGDAVGVAPRVAGARHTSATPSSAVHSDTIAPAANARQMFPPTVATFHTLNDASRACALGEQRHRPPRSAISGELGDRARRTDSDAGIRLFDRRPPHRREVDGPVASGRGSEYSQVPPPRNRSPVPGRDRGANRRGAVHGHGVQVHGSFREVATANTTDVSVM